MKLHFLSAVVLLAQDAFAQQMLRFACSQLVVERLDPVAAPGSNPSPHLHQIAGGNSFNKTMAPGYEPETRSTCTSCTFSQDFSNYWTASLFFKARNGSFTRVPQFANQYLNQDGGLTVYYIPPYDGVSTVTAFQPGFRMIVGSPLNREAGTMAPQICHRCFGANFEPYGGAPCTGDDTVELPSKACLGGIRTTVTFPTCWDGKNLDSEDHASHVAYPNGAYEMNAACPSTHPVKIPQLMYEVMWDTRQLNDASQWPEDGSQPFLYSYGDMTGYGQHGDYMFGWEGDSLQQAMDARCNVACPQLQSQADDAAMNCKIDAEVDEPVDGWLDALPGNREIYT